MASYDVDARHLGALIRTHERERRDSLSGAVRAAAKTAQRIIQAAAPKAHGDLRRSVEVQGAEVVVTAPHAVAVEVGQLPHRPPILPLIRWAQAIGADDPKALAEAAAAKIEREGVRPTWFVRGSIPKIMEATGASVRYVLKK